ncbi:hypothetical protein STRAU_0096 [Streptomyces aurantiacus JA 4570]|uniref:Uncharacterized protein n=1 Tax=Streptomyces aurantiacus JA 4570 TaxID=1286094 RepID=S3ZVL8_9ACTN|nr:hypothetical protein STRAU_0096 [Streptomyces aurantiacus JA 4570]
MNAPARSPLEGQPAANRGWVAELASPAPAVGAPKGVAEGVLSALRPDPHIGDGRYPIAWLHIVAPRGAVPTATSRCACGRDRSAVGHRKVLALIDDHTAHGGQCPLRTPQEGRNAV